MQQFKTNLCFALLVFVLISCKESATISDKTEKDTVPSAAVDNTASMPAYDPTMDPFTVSGSNAKLIQDTLGLKVFEWWVKPGEFLPLHKHPDHAMYVLEGGTAMVYSKDFPGGEKGFPMEVKAGQGWVGGPVTDSARNIGKTTIRMVEVDVYRPRNK
jgi:mannose-6-phosphate isomerase-like protein (cupin superfamily)